MKNKKKWIGSIIILIGFIIFLCVGYWITRPTNFDEKDIFIEEKVGSTAQVSGKKELDIQSMPIDKDITVYIDGEVRNPAVYKLKSGSRIEDLIKAAGGFKETADKTKINLAKKLRDEDYIYVYERKENSAAGSITVNSSAPSAVQTEEIMNVNTATKEQLMTLPGVGEVTAQKIIDYREKNGGFNSVDDLMNVDRIGEKTLSKFRDKVDIR